MKIKHIFPFITEIFHHHDQLLESKSKRRRSNWKHILFPYFQTISSISQAQFIPDTKFVEDKILIVNHLLSWLTKTRIFSISNIFNKREIFIVGKGYEKLLFQSHTFPFLAIVVVPLRNGIYCRNFSLRIQQKAFHNSDCYNWNLVAGKKKY